MASLSITEQDRSPSYNEAQEVYTYKQMRASMLGKNYGELYKYLTTKSDASPDSILGRSARAGTLLHKITQAKQVQAGQLAETEKFVYDKKHNITGHIDAITAAGAIGDIKTVSPKIFREILTQGPKSAHVSQVNFYLYTQGKRTGYIEYINREDTSQRKIYTFTFNPTLLKTDLRKLETIRQRIEGELASGALKPEDLRMGASLETLEKEAIESTGSVKEDINRLPILEQEYLEAETELRQSYLNSNKSLNPVASRVAKNHIEGMQHGWFGNQRRENTGFGSPYDLKTLMEAVTNQFGLDIETSGFAPSEESIVSIGVQKPDQSLHQFAVTRKGGIEELKKTVKGIVPFLARDPEGLLASFEKNKVDLVKDRAPEEVLFQAGKEKIKYNLSVVHREMAKTVAENLAQAMTRGTNKPVNLIIHNANFEIRHFNKLMGKQLFGFSEEYNYLIKQNLKERKSEQVKLNLGLIKKEHFRKGEIRRQVAVYEQMMADAVRGGTIVDTQELAKTLNALIQERGFSKIQYEIPLGTSVNFLAGHYFGEKEYHIDPLDVRQQNRLAPLLVQNIEDLKNKNLSLEEIKNRNPLLFSHIEKMKDKKFVQSLKVQAQKSALENMLEHFAKSNNPYTLQSGRVKVKSYQEGREFLSRTGRFVHTTQGERTINYGLTDVEIIERAETELSSQHKNLFQKTIKQPLVADAKFSKYGRQALIATGVLAAVAATKYIISGRDDDYNTIEGLRHGWFGSSRKYFTDFGSGYIPPSRKETSVDPTPFDYAKAMTYASGVGLLWGTWGVKTRTNINDLSYIGNVPEGLTKAQFYGREKATVGDLAYNLIRRGEMAFGGLPKVFSVSSVLSPSILKDTAYTVDLRKAESSSYGKYLNELTGKNLERTFASVTYKGGKLYGKTYTGAEEVILQEARLYQRIHDKNISKAVSQYAASYEHIHGMRSMGEYEYLIGGGETRLQAMQKAAHAYAHETLSKYLRLVDDPIKAFRESFPSFMPGPVKALEKLSQYIPKFGVGGEQYMSATTSVLLKRHAARALPLLIGLPFTYGMANWAVKSLAPEDSVIGKAGIAGASDYLLKTAHLTYASVSDILGLTALRKKADELAPGAPGISTFVGLTLAGGVSGGAFGVAKNFARELVSTDKYKTLIENQMAEKTMRAPFDLIWKGKYTRTSRFWKMGAAIGAIAGAPFLLGIGSDKSREELEAEYSGEKEVAVRKARWWELGTTPWEGETIQYFRPNWYQRLLTNYKERAIYGDENINPLYKAWKSFTDPYWLERQHYEDRPYPIAGSTGEGLGIFGPLYQMTLGRVIKPPAIMHSGEWNPNQAPEASEYRPDPALGGLPPLTPINPYGASHTITEQYRATYEALGFRGFITSAIREAFTGEQELDEYSPILQSSSDIDTVRRDYWDLNLGGFFGLSEPYRRFNAKRPYNFEYVNTIPNKMPSWLPGGDYYINFRQGDPYTLIPEGEYRLPGAGYETRYKELEGVSPEDYPLIHQYKILADVAMYSNEFRRIRGQIRRNIDQLSDEERLIYTETENQILEKKKKREFQSEVYEENMFGRYAKTVFEIARNNPIEQLTPLAPAHKLLPRGDALQQYQESIFGKEFKLWQRPMQDFILPFITSTANVAGYTEIPTEIEENRRIEEYFDQLRYVKYKRLSEKALTAGDIESAQKFKSQVGMTVTGTDPYTDINRIRIALPKRERPFLDVFLSSNPEDREKILALVPDRLRDFYIAQWDKQVLQQAEAGELDISEDERYNLEGEIFNRFQQLRARKTAEQVSVETSENLPDDDWIGWREDIDLEDYKLQYLINNSKEFHYFELWDDRLRSLGRKPYIRETMEQIDPTKQLTNVPKYRQLLMTMQRSGIKNLSVIPNNFNNIDARIEYDSDYEKKNTLRELGKVA